MQTNNNLKTIKRRRGLKPKNQYQTLVNTNGQVTIPATLRNALRIEKGSPVSITLEGNELRVSRVQTVAERTAGVFKNHSKSLTAEEMRDVAAQAIAESVVERSGA